MVDEYSDYDCDERQLEQEEIYQKRGNRLLEVCITMKISVRATHYTNDNSPQLRGYATVKFDDSYVLESVKIMERQDSNEIFIALP